MANVERLIAVRDVALANPEQWDQTAWARATQCGTQMCFAGWACHLGGREFKFATGENTLAEYVQAYGAIGTGSILPTEEEVAKDPEGDPFLHVHGFARTWLDLTEDEADALFMCTNNDQALDVMNDLIDRHSD